MKIDNILNGDIIQINLEEHKEKFKPVTHKYWNQSERVQWMIALFLGCTTLFLSRVIMPICSVKLSEDLHWDKKKTGTILGAFFWGYMLSPFLGGYLSDLIGGEKVVTMVAYGWSLVTIIFAFLPTIFNDTNTIYSLFLLTRVALGFFQGFHFSSIGSLIQRVSPNKRQFTFSVITSGAHCGTLICGSLGSFALDNYGWQVPFVFSGLAGLTWAIVSRKFLLGHSNRVISYNLSSERTASTRSSVPWAALLSNPAFWAMIVGHFTHTNASYILISWLPSYFHDNFPDATSWVFNVVPWMVTIPSILLSGMAGDRLISSNVSTTFVRKLMSTVSLLGVAIFLFLISFSPGYYVSLLFMALAICCSGFHGSGISLNPQDIVPEFGGTVSGVMHMIGAIPGFVGVYIAGYILETTKSWSMVFNQTGALCVIGWIVFMIFGTGRRIL